MSQSNTDSAAVVVIASVVTLLLASVIYVDTNQMSTTTHQRTQPKVEYPRYTNVLEPAGNSHSVAFLKWARANGIVFDAVALDDSGDIVNLVESTSATLWVIRICRSLPSCLDCKS